MSSLHCHIQPASLDYSIVIQPHALSHLVSILSTCGFQQADIAIVTDEHVERYYGKRLHQTLLEHGISAHLFSFPAGEAYKTRTTKEALENAFFQKGLGKETCVIGLGGGVVTDLAGYLAATYCRGIPLVMIPTTLLGMVDASIGGKVGVNSSYGKNMVGCIYQPRQVIIDPELLKTLPIKELKNGFVEMIKHGCVIDHAYYHYLEEKSEQLMALNEKKNGKSHF